MQYSKEQINEKFQRLSEKAQNLLLSDETVKVIQSVGKKYQLQIDQMGILNEEIVLAAVGLTPSNDFKSNIRQKLNVAEERAQKITREIDELIFKKIRASLQMTGAHQSTNDIEAPQTKSPVVPQEAIQLTETGDIAPKTIPTSPTASPAPSVKETPPAVQQETSRHPTGTPPANLPTGDIAAAQLKGEMHVPKLEKEIPVREKTSETPTDKERPIKKEHAVDPYREPIDDKDKQMRQL